MSCAAESVMGNSSRRQANWFRRLEQGQPWVMEAAPQPGYSTTTPSLLVAARAATSREGVVVE